MLLNFKISHLDGSEILIRSTEIIKPNMEYIVIGEGLKSKSGESGNLIINFNIIFPDNLNAERKKYLYKLLPVNENGYGIGNEYKILAEHQGEVKYITNNGEKIDMEEVNLNSESGRDYESQSGQNEGVECVQQ